MSINNSNTLDINDISKILSQRAFGTMIKPIGSRCNLNCTYCYYLHRYKNHSQGTSLMSEELLEEYIKQYIEAQQVDTVTFCWHGGEPTLAPLEYYENAVELQKKHSCGKKIINTFQTNGTLINLEWCKFFRENDILVGLSIDGPKEIHDHNRFWTKEKSSFEAALKSAQLFHHTGVEFNTLTTVNKYNEDKGKEIYTFLRDVVGSRFMQFLPVSELITLNNVTTSDQLRNQEKTASANFKIAQYNNTSAQISPWSVSPIGYGKFLTNIFDLWVQRDVGNIFVQIFDTTLANWCGYPPGVCTLGEYCSDSLTIESNGDVYPCDHFAFEEYKLGNITQNSLSEIYDFPKRIEFSLAKKKELCNECLQCKYLFACHGECPQHRFRSQPDEPSKSYLCQGLKDYFEYVEPYMEYMKMLLERGLPPAQIMQVAKEFKRIKLIDTKLK